MPPDGKNHPDDCPPDNQNVQSSQGHVSQSELDWRENEIGGKVDGEGERHPPWQFPLNGPDKHEPEADQDDGVKDLPDETNGPRGRSPIGFDQGIVPGFPIHNVDLLLLDFDLKKKDHPKGNQTLSLETS